MSLAERRRAIRPLLDERNPADAMAAYYAFYHPDKKTTLITEPAETAQARGYIALSRTGIDLFRPLLTMRLPANPDASADLIYRALPTGTAVLVSCRADYLPLLQAFFNVQTAQHLRSYVLNPRRFEPIINVLVARAASANGLPRFVIRQPSPDGDVVASASLNWQSPHFAEIAVRTSPAHRRRGWGRSVVAAMANYLLENGRTPLYVAAEANTASQQLAESVGFRPTGAVSVMLEASLRPRP